MARVAPFHGLRYDPVRVSMDAVLAPPYDVIDKDHLAALRSRDPHNIVWVDCPVTGAQVPTAPDRAYCDAARHLKSWTQEGFLKLDSAPSFYIAEHSFSPPEGGSPVNRRGIFAHATYDAIESGEMLPHERTLAGPKQDRLKLLRATHTQTSPIFALWDNAPNLDPIMDAASQGAAPIVAHTTEDGSQEHHRLWPVSDPTLVEALSAAFSPATLYIADGHHRWETVTGFMREEQPPPSSKAARAGERDQGVLVYLSDAADPGLIMLPTHRMVIPRRPELSNSAALASRLGSEWKLTEVASLRDGLAAATDLRDSHHAYVAVFAESVAVLARSRQGDADPRASLDTVVLEEQVLAPSGIDHAAIEHGALRYSRSAQSVESAVNSGAVAMGFILNASSPRDMMAVAAAGEVMPQKSTYFYPRSPPAWSSVHWTEACGNRISPSQLCGGSPRAMRSPACSLPEVVHRAGLTVGLRGGRDRKRPRGGWAAGFHRTMFDARIAFVTGPFFGCAASYW